MLIRANFEGKCGNCEVAIPYGERCIERKEGVWCPKCHMAANLIPWGDGVYIQMEERADQVGSIVLPTHYQQRTEVGIIISYGESVSDAFKKAFKPGDRVIYSYYNGTHIQLPETFSKEPVHRILADHEILAKYEE